MPLSLQVDVYKRQALALRAFCYLHLVQHYQFTYLKDKDAPCVPIYTEPSNNETVPKLSLIHI